MGTTQSDSPQLRILHTSDWHLGQHFFGKSRDAEHAAFIDWLLSHVEQYQVDALIIAGDIFDTGTPPSYARTRYNQFVVALSQIGCQLVVLGGNHDSVATLHESRELLACLNATVIGTAQDDLSKQLVTLKNRAGEPAGILCGVPFLRQRDLLHSRAGDSAEEKQQQLMFAMTEHYADLFELAQQRQQLLKESADLPILATGHMTCVGGQLSESVREIYIGTLEAFPAKRFPKADYIALGHLHRPQKVASSEHIRYSGSPLPLSFDETGSDKSSGDKQILMVDFAEGKLQHIEPVIIPRFRRLQSIEAPLDELPELLQSIADQSEADPLQPWVEVVIDAEQYISDLQKQIQQISEQLPLEILRVRRKRAKTETSLQQQQKETLAELKVEDVFNSRLADEALETQQIQPLTELFQQIVQQLEQPEPDQQQSDQSESDQNQGRDSKEAQA
ncbi:exonuclease subunit SbcD [Pelagibaculum spongiae]|uniref:exonuclease subunit SbcD n=1 Tax=Pelagibaculum spongiae TaxID=2080658 RepID=UPI001F4E6BD5|nr:exonuclease subunit SbcD [Pelagibaculum spongiae]